METTAHSALTDRNASSQDTFFAKLFLAWKFAHCCCMLTLCSSAFMTDWMRSEPHWCPLFAAVALTALASTLASTSRFALVKAQTS